MTYKILARGLIAVAVIHLPLSASYGQTLKYESKAEVFGAAMTSPSVGKVVIEKLFTHCASYGNEVKEKQGSAMRSWLEIHQPLIDENIRLREEFRRNASSQAVEQLEIFLESQVPRIVEAQYQRYAVLVDVLPDSQSRASMCLSFAESVADGQWNLSYNDPVIFGFLQDSIATRKKRTR